MRGIFFLVLFLVNFVSFAQTIIPGGNVSGAWGKVGSPYLIQDDISIVSSLTIEPGVEVNFENYALFQIFGTLTAAGQIDDSITFTVSDTTGFYNSTHAGWGGLDFLSSYSSSELSFCIVEYSKAPGIFISDYGNLDLSFSSVRFNTRGIRAWSYNSSLTISNTKISYNDIAGVSCWMANSVELNNVVISNNGMGLGIAGYSNINLTDFNISNNINRGILTDGDPYNQLVISNGTINNNNGGGAYFGWIDDIEMSNVIIEGNGPAEIGGGIYSAGFSSFENLTISQNSAVNGGGLAFSEFTLSISNSTIENNIADGFGGGFYSFGYIFSIDFTEVKLSENNAQFGGGMYLSSNALESEPTLSKVEISKNHVSIDGGAIYCKLLNFLDHQDANFNHLTIADNTSDSLGGGITIAQNNVDSIIISNSIIWNNTPAEIIDLSEKLKVEWSDVNNGWPGMQNLNSNPLFVDDDNGDYNLSWMNFPLIDSTKSPCIGTGFESSDMGAYPFDQIYFEQFLPIINSVADVPNDQGKEVTINWTRSVLDAPDSGTIVQYSIWRLQNETKNQWEFISSTPAFNTEVYSAIAPTLSDSCANGNPYFTFLIKAETEDPDAYYFSYPDSGYSVDNIAPSIPIGFSGFYKSSFIELSWNPCPESDFSEFALYRSADSISFPAEPLILLTDTSYTDLLIEADTFYYWLSAFDINNNESTPTDQLIIPVLKEITLDLKIYLEGPFNDSTMMPSLNCSNLLPHDQPYFYPPWNYAGTESVSNFINDSIVDWMLIELRDADSVHHATAETRLARQAAFVLIDGTFISQDQFSFPRLTIKIKSKLFIAIHHRNHISVISNLPIPESNDIYNYNFSLSPDLVYGGEHATSFLGAGKWGMIASDANADGQIDNVDKNDFWYLEYNAKGYKISDFNMDGSIKLEDIENYWLPNVGKGNKIPD